MKVLYAIQGTGNGHLSRARDVVPALIRQGVDLDLLVSGTQADIQLPHQVKFRFEGLSFIFGKKGGVDMWRTYLKSNTMRFQKEMKQVPVNDYDLVINDFEPVSAWACKLKNKPCISFSHQAAVLSPNAPKPKNNDLMGKLILKKYAPTTLQYGLHFNAYEAHMYTPIIRQEIRQAKIVTGNHYTVYLPSYSDEKILGLLSLAKGVTWDVFSKHNKRELRNGNIRIRPITNEAFISSMAGSEGILCGAGFEAPAEALFLGKKLMVIPMKGQYEQQCNMAALKQMGVPVLKSLKRKHLGALLDWIETETHVEVDYPDITDHIIDRILQETILV
jgi:uncharacterized protein (TIGR00661 family)